VTPRTGCTSRPNANCASTTEAAPAGYRQHSREGVSFQRLKTWKASKDPDYAVKEARAEHLYAIADREVIPEPGEPEVIFCVDLCRHRNYADVLALCAGP
jgi:hypothetical protein